MNTILLVEDDPNTMKLTKMVLHQGGYDVLIANDGHQALCMVETHHIDCIVLDIMLPKMDGYQVASTLRENGYGLPILMLTAKETTFDKVKGFDSGADDYCVKPIDSDELLARIHALLRRSHIAATKRIDLTHTHADYATLSIVVDGSTMTLPAKEFYILFKLLSYPNHIFTRHQLMEEFWSMDSLSDPHTVDVHINRLRNKFKENPDFEIVTVRGLGYKAVLK